MNGFPIIKYGYAPRSPYALLTITLYFSITSINITRNNYQFVPLQDFSKPWTDEELYKKYGLTDEEIQFIESMIRPME